MFCTLSLLSIPQNHGRRQQHSKACFFISLLCAVFGEMCIWFHWRLRVNSSTKPSIENHHARTLQVRKMWYFRYNEQLQSDPPSRSHFESSWVDWSGVLSTSSPSKMKPSEMLSGVVKSAPPKPAHEGPVEESIFNIHLLFHCLPAFSMVSSLVFVNVMSIPFYTSIGVPVEYLLLAVALSRAVDAMTDPFIAHWFESIRPEFTNDEGVRNQACLAGGITSAVLLGLHLSPPPGLQTNSAILSWFSCTYIFFTIAFSFVLIPLTAALWKQYAYQGSIGEFRRTGTALFTELVLHGGLALMFFLTGYAPAVDRYAKGRTNGEYDSCYSPSGVGESCMVHPNDGSRVLYNIFNATVWDAGVSSGTSSYVCQSTLDGTLITDYTTLFTPEKCIAKMVSSETNACLQQYCACVGECSNLSNMVTRRVCVGAAGWRRCSVLIFAVLVVMVHLHGWKELVFPAKSRRRTANVEGSNTAVTVATTLPLEPLVPKLVNLLRNKTVRSFLLPWALDTIMFMTVLGTVGYFVRSVIKPEYAEDCNSAVPVFGTISDLWRCQNRAIASLQLTLISLSSGIFAFGWFYLSRVVGTVRAWQLGSLICMLTILALLFSAQRNDVNKSLGLGLLFGVGVGSQFLSESVVIDVIHYYEFISGRQYQATFAMIKYLFLKLSIVLMHMIPISLFYEAKFDPVPPAYVKTLLDIGPEGSLCQVFTVAIPAILCAASFYFKMHFRLVDKEQFDLTAEGIRTLYHGTPISSPPTSSKPVTNTPAPTPVSSPIPASSKRSQRGVTPPPAPVAAAPAEPMPVVVSATDPTSGVMYPQDAFSQRERQVGQVFSFFIEPQNTIDYNACVQSRSWAVGRVFFFSSVVESPFIALFCVILGNEVLIGRIRDIFASIVFLGIALVVGLAVSADCLENKSGLFIIPVRGSCFCCIIELLALIPHTFLWSPCAAAFDHRAWIHRVCHVLRGAVHDDVPATEGPPQLPQSGDDAEASAPQQSAGRDCPSGLTDQRGPAAPPRGPRSPSDHHGRAGRTDAQRAQGESVEQAQEQRRRVQDGSPHFQGGARPAQRGGVQRICAHERGGDPGVGASARPRCEEGPGQVQDRHAEAGEAHQNACPLLEAQSRSVFFLNDDCLKFGLNFILGNFYRWRTNSDPLGSRVLLPRGCSGSQEDEPRSTAHLPGPTAAAPHTLELI